MSTPSSAAIRMVRGVKNDDGGYAVFVRVGEAAVKVDMLHNSAIPFEGDGILVLSGPDGNFGVALPRGPLDESARATTAITLSAGSAPHVGEYISINLPVATGAVPIVGLYAPVLVDANYTILGLRVRFTDIDGNPVSDTAELTVRRIDWATDTASDLNASPFGPSAAMKAMSDASIFSSTDLTEGDTLQARVDTAPSVAIAIAVSLKVVRA